VISSKKSVWDNFCMDSGVLRVTRGGSGAQAPPLAACPSAAFLRSPGWSPKSQFGKQ